MWPKKILGTTTATQYENCIRDFSSQTFSSQKSRAIQFSPDRCVQETQTDHIDENLDLTNVTPIPDATQNFGSLTRLSITEKWTNPLCDSNPSPSDLENNLLAVRDETADFENSSDPILQMLLAKRQEILADIDIIDTAIENLHSWNLTLGRHIKMILDPLKNSIRSNKG